MTTSQFWKLKMQKNNSLVCYVGIAHHPYLSFPFPFQIFGGFGHLLSSVI